MEQITSLLKNFDNILLIQQVVIGTVLGVLFTIAKAISNQQAGPIVSKIQNGFDFLSVSFSLAGSVCKKIADFLAQLLKSDGILGKK